MASSHPAYPLTVLTTGERRGSNYQTKREKKKEKERPIHKGKGIPVNGYLSTLFFSLRLILLAFPVSLLAQFLSLSAIAQQ